MAIVKHIHQSLIDRCKTGDSRAQYELYQSYSKAMLNVAFRILNDIAEAEDVLQEAFVRAFSKLHTYKGDSTFGAWLKRIVVNTSINHLRSKKLDTVTLEEGRFDIPDECATVSLSGDGLNMQKVRRAIAQLPEGYRMVFSLYLIEGYDHKEIGSILKISEATSKSQYSRAKKRLREILNKENYVRQA